MSETLKLDMTVDEALAFAEEWTRGMTLHAGLQGWRVVCLLLGEEVKALREELETERMRLAACGTAALGYFDGCNDEYRSASLEDVLRLREKCADLESQLAELRQGGEAVVWIASDDLRQLRENPGKREVIAVFARKECSVGPTSPLFTRPQPAIPPGYALDDASIRAGASALLSYYLNGGDRPAHRPVTDFEIKAFKYGVDSMLASAPAIQPQAASVPVAEKDSAIEASCGEFRDSILHEVGPLEINYILSVFDSTIGEHLFVSTSADSKEGEK